MGVLRSQNSRMLRVGLSLGQNGGRPLGSCMPAPGGKRAEGQTQTTHNWRHMPQGLAGGAMSVATATLLNFLWPSVTALPKATRSAHVPTG